MKLPSAVDIEHATLLVRAQRHRTDFQRTGFLGHVEEEKAALAQAKALSAVAVVFKADPNEQRQPLSIRPALFGSGAPGWQTFSGETPFGDVLSLADAAAQLLARQPKKAVKDGGSPDAPKAGVFSVRHEPDAGNATMMYFVYVGAERALATPFATAAEAFGAIAGLLPPKKDAGDIIRKYYPLDDRWAALVALLPKGQTAGLHFQAIASTADRDRQGDTISLAAWDTKAFLASGGPILSGHDQRQPPVAKTERLVVEANALRFTGRFPEPGTSPRADEARGLVAGRFLTGVSVGFRSTKPPTQSKTGFDYVIPGSVELLELSLVSVPANTKAVVERVW